MLHRTDDRIALAREADRLIAADRDDRFLRLMERACALPDDARAAFLDTFLDVVDPQDAPRPHADPVRVAELRAEFAELLG